MALHEKKASDTLAPLALARFAFQKALMVLDCTRGLILDKLAWLLPEHVRRWWLSGPK